MIIVERQPDKCFAVYISGDDDPEGNYDRMFSWGKDEVTDRVVTIDQARGAALEYAIALDKKLGGGVFETENRKRAS